MIQPTKAALREQLALAGAENLRLSRSIELVDACSDYWQAEAQLTLRRRLLRWMKRRRVS